MFTKTIATSLAVVSLFASISMAQEETQTQTMAAPKPSSMNVNDPVGWFPFIGLSGGYMSPDDVLLTEGVPGDIKIIGSHFGESRHSIWDVGLGFMGTSFTQKSTTENNFISGGLAELAWRYNSTGRWQIGPIVNTYIGGGERFGSSDPNLTTFAGLQLVKEFAVKNTSMFRIGLKGLADLSIPDGDISTVMLDLQWGFGGEQKGPDVAQTEDTMNTGDTTSSLAETAPESDMAESARAAAAATGATMGINARRVIETDPTNNALLFRNDARMHFDTGSATLTGVNADFVESLGRTLSERSDLFDKVEVIGYADQTGSRQINTQVSRSRANSVANSLTAGGLPKAKVQSSWKGSSDLLYQSLLPEDMQQNRRVDIKFHGVKDQAALEQLLSGL
ncbi:OmpA family protein [Bdellovibrio sp. HCB337]|uniref:OmpA family protein n=1 Tax=Bdellovibrio sp. HCB337 TaxID=3394358 RepID=UPI0039A5AAB2